MRPLSRALAVFVVAAVLAAGVAAPVAAQSDGGTDGSDPVCFPGDGHELDIGTEGPAIAVTVHTSLFTNLTDAGALGVEARGTALNATIIELRTGVVFDGVGPAEEFLADPFSRFAVLFDYSFELPMFAGVMDDPGYETDESPVSGVESRGC